MTERVKELISALVDDDLSPDEVDELCACWRQQPMLAPVLGRYVTIGALLRRGSDPVGEHADRRMGDRSIAVRVREALDRGDGADLDLSEFDLSEFDVRPAQAPAVENAAVNNVIDLPPVRRRWVKAVGTLALAASVAAVAIGGLRMLNASDPSPAALASNGPAVTTVAPTLVSSGPAPALISRSLRWNVQQPAVEKRLNAYLVQHSEVMRHGVRGMLPYTRVVGYESSRP